MKNPAEKLASCARGNNVMQAMGQTQQTAAVLRNGWYYSGDLGYMDDEGYVILVDRAKDMIVSGGERLRFRSRGSFVFASGRLEAAVFGIPDERWEKQAHSCEKRSDVTDQELIEFCREHIAGTKGRACLFQEEALPKSNPGKVLKRELRKPFWEGKESGIN